MEKRKVKKAHKIRFFIFTILGILTLIPFGDVSKVNLIAYKSICTLTPISTIICFGLAVLFILKYQKSLKTENI